MGLLDWLFGTNASKTKADEKDPQRWENYQYGEEPTKKQVEDAWHQAREDARNDPRSKDPKDVGYTGDWKKKKSG